MIRSGRADWDPAANAALLLLGYVAFARFAEREQAEYYLLGTFASFAWAVVLTLLAQSLG